MTDAIRRALARRARGDAGFTLIEVIVAMVITLMVMTALSYVVVSSLRTIQQAKQRQTATALATQELERLRAMPYDDVTVSATSACPLPGGNPHTTVSGTNIFFAAPVSLLPGVGNEPLVVNCESGRWKDEQVDQVTYRVYTYVTQPALTASGTQAFNLTVLVHWTSSVWPSGRWSVERTTTFSPAGCLSTATSPFAAPCQVYVTARAGEALAGVSVSNADGSLPGLLNTPSVNQLQLAFPTSNASFFVEQTATGTATASTTSSLLQGPSSVDLWGGQSAKAAVDSDPSSAPDQSVNSTSPGHPSATVTVNNGQGVDSRGTLILTQGGGDTGRASAAIAADSATCRGLDDAPLATGSPARPCSSASLNPGGSGSDLVYQSPLGSGNVTLATFAPSSTSRAVAGAFGQATTGAVCGGAVSPSGTPVDCVHAAAQRSLGAAAFPVTSNVTNPGYPTFAQFDPDTGSVSPAPAVLDPTFGLWRVAGLTESVYVEDGTGARAPSFARSGTLKVWTGQGPSGYTTVSLGDYQTAAGGALPPSDTIKILPTQVQYSSAVALRFTGSVTVQRPMISSTPTTYPRTVSTECDEDGCRSSIDGSAGVVAAVQVEVLINGASWTKFAVVTDLGGLTADVSYKAATDAS